jgi:hypothetical protein
MLNTIPQTRILIYLLVSGLLPILFTIFHFYGQLESIKELENTLWHVQELAYNREKKQSVNIAVRNHFRDADHFYIDKNLETLSFLEPEAESLRKIADNPNFPDDENIKKRLELLTSPANNLVFTEGVVQSSPFFQEVTETLVHPVEINVTDLQEILCRIEGIAIGPFNPPPNRPQLVILDFKLDKKNVSDKNEAFLLNLKLLKREFL